MIVRLTTPRARLALTSDFPTTPTPEVVTFLREATSARSPRIAWVPSVPSEQHWLRARAAFAACGLDHVEPLSIGDELTGFDVVYLPGGDPVAFRLAARSMGFDRRLISYGANGGTIVAASGGAVSLSSNVSLFRLLTVDLDQVIPERGDHAGAGLIQVELIPHFSRHGADFVQQARSYVARTGAEVLGLDDGSALLCAAGGVRVVGRVVPLG